MRKTKEVPLFFLICGPKPLQWDKTERGGKRMELIQAHSDLLALGVTVVFVVRAIWALSEEDDQ